MLSKWLRDGVVTGRQAELWREVEPVLSLGFYIGEGDSPPFYPRDVYEALDDETLVSLSTMVSEVDCDDVEARVRDIAWTRRFVGRENVGPAVDAYVRAASLAVDPAKNWTFPYKRLRRAIALGASIGRTSEPFQRAVAAIEAAIATHGATDSLWFADKLIRLLLDFRVETVGQYAELVRTLALAARARYEAVGVGDGLQCNREQAYLDLEILVRGSSISKEQRHVLELEVAEACVRQAEGVVVAQWPNAPLVASHFVEQAIARLRKAGNATERIDALRVRNQELQREAVAGFKTISVQVNVGEARQQARAAVQGGTTLDALFRLCAIYEPAPRTDLEKQLRDSLAQTPSRALIPQSFLGPRGTTLASHAGIVDQTSGTGFELELLREAAEQQRFISSLYLQSAAEQISVEHRPDVQWFLGLVHGSLFVPVDRELSFARGLFAGLDGDADGAAVFLVPQFEHAIREVFASRGVPVATLTSTGMQNELNLGQLLGHARASEILGETNVFDLRALMTEKAGSNLRNEVAHGIIGDGSRRAEKLYFWWVCLRFCLMPMQSRWGLTPSLA
ncbi:MAG: DUF4209 domain-containing protein [Kofleriaceae bacterium]